MAVVLALLVTGGLYIYRYVFSFTHDASLDGVDLAAKVKPDSSITNIALFGVDTRTVDIGTRSDTIMVLTVDNTRHKIKLTSLMRDSRVPVEGHGEDKLAHAYAYGGPELAIRTINQNFDMDITEYITVDFAQMKLLVDLVGGVYIDVSEKERKEANKFIGEYCVQLGVPEEQIPYIIKAGYQHLTGVPAMCYARIRKGGTGDDWGRVERQGIVLQAMMNQVQSMNTAQLIELMQKMMPYVTTSLSVTEILPLLVGAVKDGVPALEHTRVPLDSEWEYSKSGEYIIYDLERAAQLLNDYIYNNIVIDKSIDATNSETTT